MVQSQHDRDQSIVEILRDFDLRTEDAVGFLEDAVPVDVRNSLHERLAEWESLVNTGAWVRAFASADRNQATA